jgi:hypothetical protein
MKSFLFEPYTFLLRTVCRGMIQSLTFQYYKFQITSLMVSNIIFIIVTVIFKDKFCHKIIFIFYLLYNTFFFILDFVLVIRVNTFDYFEFSNLNYLLFIVLWIIVSCFLLMFLSLIVVIVYQKSL